MEDTLVAEKELGNNVSEVREWTPEVFPMLQKRGLNQRRADG